MEREEEEDSEETISEHDSELDLTMEEMLKRTTPIEPATTPTPTTTPTPSPPMAEHNFPTDPIISEVNMQVNEEPEEEVIGKGGSEKTQTDATASEATAPEAVASQQSSKEQAESTIQVVLRELEKKKKEEAAQWLKGLAEASGILKKTPIPNQYAEVLVGEKATGGTTEGQSQKNAEKEAVEQPSADASGATAPTETIDVEAPVTATKSPKMKVKKTPTRASSRLREHK